MLQDAVDLTRYPVHDLDGTAGRALVERCWRGLAELGAVDLEGFLRPAAVESTVRWALDHADEAYRNEVAHSITFRPADDTLPPDHSGNRVVRSSKAGLAYDRIPASAPIRTVYESETLTRFVGAAVGVDPIFRQADELGALNVMYYEPGDELGWHFDNADLVVTLMLRPAEAGGTFEYVPNLRTADDDNEAGVRALLDGDRTGVRTMSAAPGTLALFRGRFSPHRVAPVAGAGPRVNAVLSYATRPDARLSHDARRLFYGREDDAPARRSA